jgi:hypothetical protein
VPDNVADARTWIGNWRSKVRVRGTRAKAHTPPIIIILIITHAHTMARGCPPRRVQRPRTHTHACTHAHTHTHARARWLRSQLAPAGTTGGAGDAAETQALEAALAKATSEVGRASHLGFGPIFFLHFWLADCLDQVVVL